MFRLVGPPVSRRRRAASSRSGRSGPAAGRRPASGRRAGCARQVRGAGRVGPAFHPRVLQVLLALPASRVRVGGQHRLGHRRPQLPAGHAGRLRQHRSLYRGRMPFGQPGDSIDDDPDPEQVDLPGLQQRGDGRPGGQRQRQVKLHPGRTPGQRQRQRDLVSGEFAQNHGKMPRRAECSQPGGGEPTRRPRPASGPGATTPAAPRLAAPRPARRRSARPARRARPQRSRPAPARREHVQHAALGEPWPATRPIPGRSAGRAFRRAWAGAAAISSSSSAPSSPASSAGRSPSESTMTHESSSAGMSRSSRAASAAARDLLLGLRPGCCCGHDAHLHPGWNSPILRIPYRIGTTRWRTTRRRSTTAPGSTLQGIRDQAQRGVDLDGCALATLSSRAGRPPGRGCLVWVKAAGSNRSVESRA